MITVRRAESESDLDHVRRLVAGFIAWLKVLFADDIQRIDAYFHSLQPELASLPGQYAPPAGRLLLALCDDRVTGVVAMRDLGGGTCEMKRMFVDTEFHGAGVGRALAETLISEARDAHYARMRLDTSHRQVAAIRLYRRLGFKEIQPYYEISAELRSGLTFMELPLQEPDTPVPQ